MTFDFWKKTLCIALILSSTVTTLFACTKKPQEEPVNLNFTAIAPKNQQSVNLCNDEIAEFIENYQVGSSQKYYGKGDHYAMKGVLLEWDYALTADTYKILLSDNENFENAITYNATKNSLNINDLFVSTTYYWKIGAVENDVVIEWSNVYKFKTLTTPRTIDIDGVSNIRDLGGLKGANGKYVKQGVVFRAAYLNEITPTGLTQAFHTYKIKTDLDLRSAGEAGNGSPLGNDVNYIHISGPWYLYGGDGVFKPEGQNALAQELRVFADANNYPILFHCSVGRDRTGTLALLLQGLCGMSKEDIYIDYELSFFSARGCLDGTLPSVMLNQFNMLYNYVANYKDSTKSLMENCEAFVLSLGLTKQEISQIRANLLETRR